MKTYFLLLILFSSIISVAQPTGAHMSNPIIMGTYGAGTWSYSDMKNNSTANGYTNDLGQASDDIYYKFIVQGSTTITLSTCSSTFDTYLHLLDVNGTEIAFNDDANSNCPSNSLASYISTTLTPGTYYIVTEGYGAGSGNIYLSVNMTVQNPPATDNRNFVKTWTANAPEADPNNLQTRVLRDVKYSVTYFDGLGRPQQSIVKQGSLVSSTDVRADVVVPMEYDQFDRVIKKYMPYVASTSDGLYKTTATADQLSFNQSFFSGENTFYAQTDYETSPLNRVTKQMAPGTSWAGSGRGVQMGYWLNASNDVVRIWNVSNVANDFGTYSSTATYDAGKLFKNITKDEQGNQVIEFQDKNGKIVLRKVQLTAVADDGTTGSGHGGWLCTYYIYDDLSKLRAVVQPKGVDQMNGSSNWVLDASNNTTILNELTFRYEYDARGRMIMSQTPGKGAEQVVYDQRDRPVMTQDAKLRANQQWLVTTYDNFNRVVSTYKITDPSSANSGTNASNANTHRTNAYSNYTSYPTVSSYSNELLSENHYDDYTGLPSGLTSSLNASGYSTYLNASTGSPEYGETVPSSPSTLIKGAPTWTRAKVLGTTSQFNASVNLYDDKGRIVQTQTINITGGIDVVTTQHSFSGQVVRSHINHQKLTGTTQSYQVATKNTFDDLGRMILIEKNVQGTGYKQISSLQYDALGQLITKKLSPSYNNNAGLETLNYAYNIRGWLLGVNRSDLANNGVGTSKFAFELGYDKLTNSSGRNFSSAVQYNGNVTGMIWKSAGDGIRRKYDFSYDAVNRLMQGVFEQNNSDATWNNSQVNYTVKMGDGTTPSSAYDANGNIQAMTQYGWKMGQSTTTPIDNLTYSYQINGSGDVLRNKLQRVTDANNDPNSKLGDFKDGPNNGTDDYSYDPSGNLTVDNNKSASISYNYLNLPETVTVTGKGTISYTYDASGNKLQKTVSETGQPTKTTLYLFGTYENDVLQFLPQEEGRIRLRTTDNTWQYDYFLKDHLGNTRMVLTDEVVTDPYQTLTFEDANITQQNAQWENKNGQSINVSSVRTSVNFGGTTTNAMLVRQTATNGTIGASKLLKVMAGDRIHTKVDYYYATANNTNNSSTTTVSNIVSDIVTSITNSNSPSNLIKGGEATVSSQLSANSLFNTFVNPTPNNNPNTGTPLPKAYLCVLFFDDQFQFDQTSSRAYPISYSSNGAATIDRTFSNAIQAGKSGYAYIYFANESNELVYFDNFYLSHERGPISEETHYYPFGLTMAGISSKAIGKTENKYKYNGKELQHGEWNDGTGLEEYDYGARMQDPQLGRWLSIDPLAGANRKWSPYAYTLNNPIRYTDPDGMGEQETIQGTIEGTGIGYTNSMEAENMFRELFGLQEYYSSGSNTNNGQSNSTQKGGNDDDRLFTSDLREYGKKHGLDKGKSPVGFNREMGLMFEEAVLKIFSSFGVVPGSFRSSEARRLITKGTKTGVIPDGIEFGVHETDIQGFSCWWLEVKAVNGNMSLSYKSYQLMGEIDAAANTKEGKAVPCLAFVTTMNTTIGQDVLNYAESRGVLILQYIAHFSGDMIISVGTPTRKNMFSARWYDGVAPQTKVPLIEPTKPDKNTIDPKELED